MIQVSEDYLELLNSNIRPKLEPKIVLKGKDKDGNVVELNWEAKEVKTVKFKKGIDPTGNALPYIELKWTEVYKGRLNEQSFPEKYSNITAQMVVTLEWQQDLDFFARWKMLANTRWIDLFAAGQTWKFSPIKEVVKAPTLFLTARPEIKNNTITWTARDFLYFLEQKQLKAFKQKPNTVVRFKNPILYLLVMARQDFLENDELFATFSQSIVNIDTDSTWEDEELDKAVLMDDSAKNLLKNYSALHSAWLDFDNNGCLTLKRDLDDTTRFSVTGKTMYKYPTISRMADIGSYQFKSYALQENENKKYAPVLNRILYRGQTILGYEYLFDEYGRVEGEDKVSEINLYITNNASEQPSVIPISQTKTEQQFNNAVIVNGDVLSENNKVNPYTSNNYWARKRFEFFNKYYKKELVDLEFEGLTNIALETGDLISVETNLFDEEDERVQKNAIVTEIEINYNGIAKQKVKAHERGFGKVKRLKGDVDGDGRITLADISLIQQHLVQVLELTEAEQLVADVNNDGEVSLMDMVYIQRHLEGIEIITEVVEI